MRLASLCLVLLAAGGLAGCAAPTPPDPVATAAIAYAPPIPAPDQPMPPTLSEDQPTAPRSDLAGRTLEVGSESDLVLAPHEVILTFDDGPDPKYTPEILAILDRYGVRATFMMVGQMAERHPETAQAVALAGETIGTHTFRHSHLAKEPEDVALADIRDGRQAVAAALAPVGASPAPFFRYPYLAKTPFLEAALAEQHQTALGVAIDSKDYYDVTPDQVLQHLLDRLDAVGKGIVLMHDIHERTVEILPRFLDALEERGYKVVNLVPKPENELPPLHTAKLI